MGTHISPTMNFSNKGIILMFCLHLATLRKHWEKKNPCPRQWVDATFVDLGCLLLNSNTSYTWEEANIYCQEKENATLIEIKTEEQLEYLQMELFTLEGHEDSRDWWTAGTDLASEGNWYWAVTLKSVGSFIWSKENNEPTNSTIYNCLYLHNDYGYFGSDIECTNMMYPICQQII